MSVKTLLRKGDLVQLISGSGSGRLIEVKEKKEGRPLGLRGRIRKVLRVEGKAIVDGVRVIRKAMRPDPKKGHRGGIVEKEAPVPLSNLMLVCRKCDRPVRARKDRSGEKARRVCARCGEEI